MGLYCAVALNNIEAVRQLLREGASPTGIFDNVNILFVSLKLMKKFVFVKFTPLHLAAACEEKNEILKLFLSRKDVDVDFRRPHNNETPLHVACYCGAKQNIQTLLSFNASTKSQNSSGNTPKQLATQRGASNEIIQLLEEGEKV